MAWVPPRSGAPSRYEVAAFLAFCVTCFAMVVAPVVLFVVYG